jgi:hypothetical protein
VRSGSSAAPPQYRQASVSAQPDPSGQRLAAGAAGSAMESALPVGLLAPPAAQHQVSRASVRRDAAGGGRRRRLGADARSDLLPAAALSTGLRRAGAPRGRLAAPGTQIVRDVVRASRSTGGAGTVQPLARALAARNHSSVRLPFAARPNYALQQTGPDGIRLSTQHQVLHNQDPELSHPDRPAAERGRYAAPIPPV